LVVKAVNYSFMKSTAFGQGACELAIGPMACRIEWSGKGLRRFSFKEVERKPRGVTRPPDGCPPFVVKAVSLLHSFFSGGQTDFSPLPLDLEDKGAFYRRVYRVVRAIPRGRKASYGEVAARAGSRSAARAVGAAMKQNPLPIFIPCHRVVRSDGGLGGFSAPGGVKMKRKLLEMEARERKKTEDRRPKAEAGRGKGP